MEFSFHSKNCDLKKDNSDTSIFSECIYKQNVTV